MGVDLDENDGLNDVFDFGYNTISFDCIIVVRQIKDF